MTRPRRRFASITDAFVIDGRLAWPILVAYIALNAIVLLNAILHDSKVGYDASAHLKYATTLARTGWLPTDKDTHEFFSPPLPYVPTAILWATLDAAGKDGRAELVLKIAQLVQVVYSLVLTLFVIKLARLIPRGGAFLPACALLLLGLIPAYYRTFAMIRGEPLLATLTIAATYWTIRTFALRRPTIGAAVLLGVMLGLAVISRQWGFFLLPALGLVGLWRLIADRDARGATIRAGLVTLVTFAVVGLPFYAHLHQAYGSMRAFNRAPEEDDAPKPDRAKTDFATMFKRLATMPLRDELIDHPVAIFYADVWGDYWRYYVVYAREPSGKGRFRYVKPVEIEQKAKRWPEQSNFKTIPAYLGRNCVAGALPTTLFAVGVIGGLLGAVGVIRRRLPVEAIALPTLAAGVVTTLAGYVWFVSSYPSDEGDTIKASYPLQIYGPLAILGAAVLARVYVRWPKAGWMLVGVFTLVAIHSLPAGITRYR